jgi:hypothetical protein
MKNKIPSGVAVAIVIGDQRVGVETHNTAFFVTHDEHGHGGWSREDFSRKFAAELDSIVKKAFVELADKHGIWDWFASTIKESRDDWVRFEAEEDAEELADAEDALNTARNALAVTGFEWLGSQFEARSTD